MPALLAGEHGPGDGRVLFGPSAGQIVRIGPADAEGRRIQRPLGDLAGTELEDPAGSGGGDLIDAVMAGDHPGVFRARGPEDLDHPVGQRRVGGADELATDPARMGQRTQHVEHGGDAEAGPYRSGETHGRMEGPGEGETQSVLGDLGGQGLGGDVEVDTEMVEQVEGS